MTGEMVLLGEIGRPHGVRGLVRVRSFTAEPEDLTAYGPLTDQSGTRRFVLEMLTPDMARIEGVSGVHSSFVMRKVIDTTALPLSYL